MYNNITFISTIHKGIGKCNAYELCKIIEQIKPEVIFLEALQGTYTKYDYQRFSEFGVNHEKLEVAAIQMYQLHNNIKYIPVLDIGLSDAFDSKYKIVGNDYLSQQWVDAFNDLASEHGFNFLNSLEGITLQEEMRKEELSILNDIELATKAAAEIDEYENSMLRNIYFYCKAHPFSSAIFMCGVAHRKSIIEKIEKVQDKEEVNLNWSVYNLARQEEQ